MREHRLLRPTGYGFSLHITRPHNIGQHLLVDLHALHMLSTRQFPFSPSVHIEIFLPIVNPAFFICMANRRDIDGTFNIVLNSLNSLKYKVGRQTRKLLDATVSYNCSIEVTCISKETYLDYREMPAKASVGFIFTPDMFKTPLEFSLVPSVADA